MNRLGAEPSSHAVVLGIDAAWTSANPSGVALALRDADGWRLVECRSSYPLFLAFGSDHAPDPKALLRRAADLARRPVDLVAMDMPLSTLPITARRASDNAVSVKFGARHCSTHTPSAVRPGALSDRLRAAFAAEGYPLATEVIGGAALIEVYPHPALLTLTGRPMRLPYKYGKIAKYWRDHDRLGRRRALLAVWAEIVAALDRRVAGVTEALPLPDIESPASIMKAFEDALDAAVCAWVGICALEGTAEPLGDVESAIWVPTAPAFE